mgnify:FL=1
MIFVTVGTHEQPFNRLIEYMDHWAETHSEKVIMQTGFSTYTPKYAEWKKLYPYQEMMEMVKDASIVITHGGPSSFIMPLQFGKKPIVVPRQAKYNEHVNDHQVRFCKEVEHRMKNIILVYDVDSLASAIKNYKNVDLTSVELSNNEAFCNSLEILIEEMFQ